MSANKQKVVSILFFLQNRNAESAFCNSIVLRLTPFSITESGSLYLQDANKLDTAQQNKIENNLDCISITILKIRILIEVLKLLFYVNEQQKSQRMFWCFHILDVINVCLFYSSSYIFSNIHI